MGKYQFKVTLNSWYRYFWIFHLSKKNFFQKRLVCIMMTSPPATLGLKFGFFCNFRTRERGFPYCFILLSNTGSVEFYLRPVLLIKAAGKGSPCSRLFWAKVHLYPSLVTVTPFLGWQYISRPHSFSLKGKIFIFLQGIMETGLILFLDRMKCYRNMLQEDPNVEYP